jgi:hypothetical protein
VESDPLDNPLAKENKRTKLVEVLLFLELLLDRRHPSRVTAGHNEYPNLELPGDWANPDSSGAGLFNTDLQA